MGGKIGKLSCDSNSCIHLFVRGISEFGIYYKSSDR